MAWVYDPTTHRYTNGKRILSEREMLDVRNAIADGMTEDSASLAQQLVSGALKLVDWTKAFARLLTNGIASAFMFGRGGKAQMDETATATLSGLIADQHGYAKDFVTDLATALDAGTATEEGVAARSALYSGAAVEAFHQGQVQDYGFSFDAYPGDGTSECLTACRCELQITDEDDENWAVSWITVGDSKVCPTCEDRGMTWAKVLVPKVAA